MLNRAQLPHPRITIIVASDLPIARAALHSWLCAQPSIYVAAEIALDNAIEHVRRHRPQVVVLHLGESSHAALKLTQSIRKEVPSTAVVVVTDSAEQTYVRSVLMAGASGYVLLRGKTDDLLTAIWKASRGSSYLDPLLSDELLHMLVQRSARTRNDCNTLCFLSEREEQVLKHIALGYTHKEIGDLLAVSKKTVDTYRARILEKTNLRTRAEIVRYAIALGLLSGLPAPLS